MIKDENNYMPISVIIRKVLSNEKIVIPRLKVFEEICPSLLE